jgi:hypothetical protein
MTEGYVLTDTKGKRIKDFEGKLTPFFPEIGQCMKYWRKYLGCSQAVKFHKVNGDSKKI